MTKYKSETVAFLGLGAMGQGMATNLQRKGVSLTVYDIDPARCAPAVEQGARLATGMQDAVRNADIVFTMLPATQHVKDALLGKNGVTDTMPKGGIIVDLSTISATGSDEIGAACRDRGFTYIDSPVGRLVIHAVKGESLFMVGCDDDDAFDTIKPLLDKMGTTIYRTGGPGTGTRAKIVNNYMILSIAQITTEGLLLAAKLGLDIDLVKEINGATTGTNGQFQVNFASKVLKGDVEPGFTVDLATKDISLALEAAAAFRIGLPVGSAVSAAFQQARSTEYAGKDITALLDFATELAGIDPIRLKAATN